MSQSLKVVVLMGGPSEEHEISLRSGEGIAQALTRRGFHVERLILSRELSLDAVAGFATHALRRCAADVAFIALHGAGGEDGTIQQVCETLGLAFTGSAVRASQLGMDKIASKRCFEQAGLQVPSWHVVHAGTPMDNELGALSYPLVVKPSSSGSSFGVSIIDDPAMLASAITLASRFSPSILLEEWIAGRELTVGVIGEQPLPVVEVKPRHAFFDYTAKYTPGQTDYLVPASLPPALTATVQAAGLAAHRALGCRHLSRTDVMLRADGVPFVLEVNTIPGFTPTSLLPKAAACIGISYDDLCERLVLMAWADRPLPRAATLTVE